MIQKCANVEYALVRKGFHRENAKHHTMFWFTVNGKKTSIRTRMSKGAAEIDNHLIACMAREMRLSKPEFLNFVACTMSGDDYLQKMIVENQVLGTSS